jgi:hypothetical protein
VGSQLAFAVLASGPICSKTLYSGRVPSPPAGYASVREGLAGARKYNVIPASLGYWWFFVDAGSVTNRGQAPLEVVGVAAQRDVLSPASGRACRASRLGLWLPVERATRALPGGLVGFARMG